MQENKDIKNQAEAYIVKSRDIHIDADYADWIADIKSRYRSAQVKAASTCSQCHEDAGLCQYVQSRCRPSPD